MILIFLILLANSLSAITLTDPTIQDTVIIGSGPAGLTAALYTSRAGLSTIVIAGRESGGQITLSPLLENFPGFPEGVTGVQLTQSIGAQAERFGAVIKEGVIRRVDLQARPFELYLDNGSMLRAHTVIVAAGASPKWLQLESEQRLIGHGVSSCAICDGPMYYGKEVVVVGGGDSAIEEALYLANIAKTVTVVHRGEQLRASHLLQARALAQPNITFIWNSVIEDIKGTKREGVSEIVVRNNISTRASVIPCQGLFIAIGHRPNSEFLEGQLAVDAKGFIVTEERSTQTSVTGVFAAGDIADPIYRQAITAAASGCQAALDATHFLKNK